MGSEYGLRLETEAAKALLETLNGVIGEDEELLEGTIEGETNLIEAVGRVVLEIQQLEALADGTKAQVEAIRKRKERFEKRAELLRTAVAVALESVGLTKVKTSSATLSVAKVAPKPLIIDESQIPSRFFIEQPPPPPKLDKKALAEELKKGPIAGAQLDNGSTSLRIRA